MIWGVDLQRRDRCDPSTARQSFSPSRWGSASWRAPGCALATTLGALEGPRPSPASVARLKSSLTAERTALANLQAARRAVNQAIRAARSEGASYTAIAAAIVPATGNMARTTAARNRAAANLRARIWAERHRGTR